MAASSKSISRVFNKQKAINRWRRFCWMLFTRKPFNNELVFFHSDRKEADRPFRTTFPATCSTRLTLRLALISPKATAAPFQETKRQQNMNGPQLVFWKDLSGEMNPPTLIGAPLKLTQQTRAGSFAGDHQPITSAPWWSHTQTLSYA